MSTSIPYIIHIIITIEFGAIVLNIFSIRFIKFNIIPRSP